MLPNREADALSVYVCRVITPQCYLSAVPLHSWEKARYVSRPPDSPLPRQNHLSEFGEDHTPLSNPHSGGLFVWTQLPRVVLRPHCLTRKRVHLLTHRTAQQQQCSGSPRLRLRVHAFRVHMCSVCMHSVCICAPCACALCAHALSTCAPCAHELRLHALSTCAPCACAPCAHALHHFLCCL